MKYNIFINQPKAIEWGLNLSESAIFSFVYELPSWAEYKIVDGKTWFFCSKNKIIEQFPLLTTKRDTVYRLLKSLEEKGLIVHEYDFKGNKDWLHLTAKASQYNDWDTSEKNPNPPGKKIRNTPEKNPINNILIDTINIDTGAGQPASSKKKEEIPIRERKINFLKLVVDWVVENPAKYPKLMINEFAKYWIEHSIHKKNVKLRFEDQQFFDISRRLSTWFKGCKDFQLQDYWAKEESTPTINELFKKLL